MAVEQFEKAVGLDPLIEELRCWDGTGSGYFTERLEACLTAKPDGYNPFDVTEIDSILQGLASGGGDSDAI